MGEHRPSSQWCRETGQVVYRTGLKLDPLLTPCPRINSKWVKDLSVRLETVKTLEENGGIRSGTFW